MSVVFPVAQEGRPVQSVGGGGQVGLGESGVA